MHPFAFKLRPALLGFGFCVLTGWASSSICGAESADSAESASKTQAETASETEAADPNVRFIDRMDSTKNLLNGRCASYRMAPDEILFSKGPGYGREGGGLKLVYRKVNLGGPYGQGGWIGYYTTLKRVSKYFDASTFTHLTFWVKGERGGERFKIAVADQQLSLIEDSVKSRPIEAYLPEGKITTDWQKATVPLQDMFVDYKMVDSISFCFENDLFDEERSEGTVYLDDLAFEIISDEEAPKKETNRESKEKKENAVTPP